MREREKKRMLEDLARIKVESAGVEAEVEARKRERIKVEGAGVGAEVEARKRELARQAHAGRQRESESKANIARLSHCEAGPEMIMDSTLGATHVRTPVTTPASIPIPPETLRAGAMLGGGGGSGGGGGGAIVVGSSVQALGISPVGRRNHLEGSYSGNGLGDVSLSDLDAVLWLPPPPPPLVYT
jgi:multidrug efflux pump subunit AcrA (membrane-fusion protein)